VRLQESRKNVAIPKIVIHKLIFQDHTLWFFEIGKQLMVMLKAKELEEILTARGARLEIHTSTKTYSSDYKTWEFDKDFFIRMDFGTFQGGSYWEIIIAKSRTFNVYGYGDDLPSASFLDEKRHRCHKHFEGDDLPTAKDYPYGEVPTKPINSNWGCIIGFLIVIVAAIIFAMVTA